MNDVEYYKHLRIGRWIKATPNETHIVFKTCDTGVHYIKASADKSSKIRCKAEVKGLTCHCWHSYKIMTKGKSKFLKVSWTSDWKDAATALMYHFTCLYVSIKQRVWTSLCLGVRPARTTLSEVAMHSTHSPDKYACGSFAPRNKASPGLSFTWLRKKAAMTPTSAGYCFSNRSTSCSLSVNCLTWCKMKIIRY